MGDGVGGDFVCVLAVFSDLASQSAVSLDWFLGEELECQCWILLLCVWNEDLKCRNIVGRVGDGVAVDSEFGLVPRSGTRLSVLDSSPVCMERRFKVLRHCWWSG